VQRQLWYSGGVEERETEDHARNAAARTVLGGKTYETFKESPGQEKKPSGFILTNKKSETAYCGCVCFVSLWCFRELVMSRDPQLHEDAMDVFMKSL